VQETFSIENITTKMVLDVKDVKGPEVVMSKYKGSPNQLWQYKNGMIYSTLNG
jgi:hypothetical protein